MICQFLFVQMVNIEKVWAPDMSPNVFFLEEPVSKLEFYSGVERLVKFNSNLFLFRFFSFFAQNDSKLFRQFYFFGSAFFF